MVKRAACSDYWFRCWFNPCSVQFLCGVRTITQNHAESARTPQSPCGLHQTPHSPCGLHRTLHSPHWTGSDPWGSVNYCQSSWWPCCGHVVPPRSSWLCGTPQSSSSLCGAPPVVVVAVWCPTRPRGRWCPHPHCHGCPWSSWLCGVPLAIIMELMARSSPTCWWSWWSWPWWRFCGGDGGKGDEADELSKERIHAILGCHIMIRAIDRPNFFLFEGLNFKFRSNDLFGS